MCTNTTKRVPSRLCLPAIAALLLASPAAAENVDPGSDGSQYAWGENIGWINAEPSADAGPGMQVDDFEVGGFLYGENVGWISLSCKNTGSCHAGGYGVRNDGSGQLSGYAWGENVGWIDFSPPTAGVLIDPATGNFSGDAWGENVGWIRFAADAPSPFKVKTAWRCAPAPPPPAAPPFLMLSRMGTDTLLSWTAVPGATAHDVVRGDLAALRSSGGDFAVATDGCLADKEASTSLTYPDAPGAGSGSWLLVRGANCGGRGSYDSGAPSQAGSRDAEIQASGHGCP